MTNKEKAEKNFNEAVEAYGKKDYEAANNYLEQAVKLNPKQSEFYNNLAVLSINYFKDYKKAKKYLEKALVLNPNLVAGYTNLAELYYEHFKDLENAQKNFLLAIEINPDLDLARKNLQHVYNFDKQTFISEFEIKEVRHLKDVKIPLSETNKKHLFLTGKNGSGKTSILKEAENYMQKVLEIPVEEIFTEKGKKEFWLDEGDYKLKFNVKQHLLDLRLKYEAGNFTIVFFGDERKLENKLKPVKSIEKIDFKLKYLPRVDLSQNLLKFLIWQDYKLKSNVNDDQIKRFFSKIHSVLKQIYKDDKLEFEINLNGLEFGDKLNFTIQLSDDNKFTLNEMAAGYSAIFEIVFELILRMEAKPEQENTEGIVLIDEPETHLHIEMQKEIMPILIKLFPNIQFIVATHSPFVLNSISNSVIYDLEKHVRAEDFSAYAYDGIVETYFDNDKYSVSIKQKLEDYKNLIEKDKLSEHEENKLEDIEDYLEEIPAQVAIELVTEFQKLKLQKIAKQND